MSRHGAEACLKMGAVCYQRFIHALRAELRAVGGCGWLKRFLESEIKKESEINLRFLVGKGENLRFLVGKGLHGTCSTGQ